MYVAPVLIAGALVGYFSLQSMNVLPREGLGPGFALTDQAGQTLTSEDLRGSVVLYTFTYTGCDDNCPQTTPVMQEIDRVLDDASWDDDKVEVKLVSITLDPEHDTPDQLKTYIENQQVDSSRWSFLTGEATILKTVTGAGFEVFYESSEDGSLEFEPAFILVDDTGIVRATYRDRIPSPSALISDLRSVTEEANTGGIAGLAYGAAHLFSCTSR